MFEKLETLRSAVKRIARDPNLIYIDQKYLDNALFTNPVEKAVVEYVWRTCPDCNDCLPNVILPYSYDNDFSTEIWIIDLDIEGLLRVNGEKDKTNENYKNFLRDHHMSDVADKKFGYDRGFVPTTQVWEKGVLKDATCYFNDEVSINDAGEYYVSRSFYSEARVANLSYTDKVVEGKVLTEADVTVGEDESISWNKDSAREIHKPLLEAFLDKYAK